MRAKAAVGGATKCDVFLVNESFPATHKFRNNKLIQDTVALGKTRRHQVLTKNATHNVGRNINNKLIFISLYNIIKFIKVN